MGARSSAASAAAPATGAAVTALGLILLPGGPAAQQKTLKDQIIGTWTFVSGLDVHPDGRKTDRWGPNPKGIFMFDGHGHFAQFITRSDLPKFTAEDLLRRLKGCRGS